MDVYKAGHFTVMLFGPFIPKFRKIHAKMGWGGRFHNIFIPVHYFSLVLLLVGVIFRNEIDFKYDDIFLVAILSVSGIFFISLLLYGIGWLRLICHEYRRFVLTHLTPKQREEWLEAGGSDLISEKKWNEYSWVVNRYRCYRNMMFSFNRPWWWEDGMTLKEFLPAYKEHERKMFDRYKELSFDSAWMDWCSYVCNSKEYNKTDEDKKAESDKEFKDFED